ncbi:MAG: deoxyribonuclease V [Chloroflexi bacterium]|nr:deoxyribonuclease V [Chloroflexota bacterium]
MQVRQLHPWDIAPAEARAVQERLAMQVIAEGTPEQVRFVAGADIAFEDRQPGRQPASARGAVVVLSYPELRLVEQVEVEAPVTFPYVPGLLAFREVPVLARAFEKLEHRPDLIIADGHGYSHPRRCGFACHLGLVLDVPTIGCAKSRLFGEHGPVPDETGARVELRDGAEVIGLVLRTRRGVSPVYVSAGHHIGVTEAAAWVLRLCRGYRLPEPVRLADALSKGRRPQAAAEPVVEQQRFI